MQMLKKMFNSDGKYYLELDDAQEKDINTATEASTEASTKTEKVAEKAVEQVATPKKELPTEAPVVKPEQKTKAIKVESKDKTSPAATTSKAVSSEQPFWVAAMYNTTNNNSNDSVSEQTFATDYLMPTITKFRRSPGPSINQFKDMAKNVRIRRR